MTHLDVAVLGVDLGKNTCSVAGLDISGAVVMRKRLSRAGVLAFAEKLSPCLIAMEACCGAHHLGRELQARGHEVRLMAPEYVQPYVKAQKTDDRDAEAIAEAATRPTMRWVPIKSEAQLDIQSLHRVRSRLLADRLRLTNQMRALLLERGIIVAQGRRRLEQKVSELIAERGGLSGRVCTLIVRMREEWRALDERIHQCDVELRELASADDRAALLMTVPGIGPLVATAVIAAVGDGSTFSGPRDFAAWLGLTPRQHSTGGRTKLLGISKRGNVYLRTQFVHGARAALLHFNATPGRTGGWLAALQARAHKNVAIVALAAKLSRIAFAVLRGRQPYRAAMVA